MWETIIKEMDAYIAMRHIFLSLSPVKNYYFELYEYDIILLSILGQKGELL
jgi:hypothetical protein